MADRVIPQAHGLEQLPLRGVVGIYFLWHRDEIVYVGQSRHITNRIHQHIADGVKRFDGVSFIASAVGELGTIERHYIRKLIPRYNRCLVANAVRRQRKAGWSPPLNERVSSAKQTGRLARGALVRVVGGQFEGLTGTVAHCRKGHVLVRCERWKRPLKVGLSLIAEA